MTKDSDNGRKARRSLRRGLAEFIADAGGASALEFALVLPILLTIMFAIIQFGITYKNYIELTDGTRSASRLFAAGSTDAAPRTKATNAFRASASGLLPARLTLTYKVNGTACATDTLCKNALAANQGTAAVVIASYPCNISFMSLNKGLVCNLTTQTTEYVE